MKLHLILIFLLGSSLAYGRGNWEQMVLGDGLTQNGSDKIKVEESRGENGGTIISVTNQFKEALIYHGYGKSSPQTYFKQKEGDEWKPMGWHWCGTGMSSYTLQPGKKVEFKFSKSSLGKESLFYTVFRKTQGEKQGYLTLLNPSVLKNEKYSKPYPSRTINSNNGSLWNL